MRFVAIACLCGGALVAAACADGPGALTSPSATSAARSVGATEALSASPRSGELHVAKECGEYTGLAGQFCTITSSNVKAIEVGSKIIYAQPIGATTLDSDIVLDTPGPGNNKAFGHCDLELATGLGVCTFSGGTGKFTHFQASAQVTPPTAVDPINWHWDGTYSFSPQD